MQPAPLLEAAPRTIDFVVPGDLQTHTGGYHYDRRVIEQWRAAGIDVRVHELAGAFPHADAMARQSAQACLAGLPANAMVICDGLAFSALPEVVAEHGHRLNLIALIHHPLSLETGLDATQRRTLFDAERAALRYARRVIVTSEPTAALMASFDIEQDRIIVAPPGTARPASAATVRDRSTQGLEDSGSTAAPAPSERPERDHRQRHGQRHSQLGRDAPVVHLLCVASLTARKGHAGLFDALAATDRDNWRLTCAGPTDRDPATVMALQKQLERLRLVDRVILAGDVSDAQLAALYAQADWFVSASRFEGYGMACAEALRYGLPVIATAVGAVPSLIEPDAGLLVPVDDQNGLIRALMRAFTEPELRTRCAAGAARAGAALQDWPAAAGHLLRALAGPGHRGQDEPRAVQPADRSIR